MVNVGAEEERIDLKKNFCDWESIGDIGVAGLEKWFDFTGVRSKG